MREALQQLVNYYAQKIKIQVTVEAYMKFQYWVDKAQGEVSALGVVEKLPGILRVTDFHLVKQICTDAERDMDRQALVNLINHVKDPSKLRCWAHSHASMAVFWSGTDEETISNLANEEWLLSLVVNHKHQSIMRLDQYSPAHMYIDNVAWELYQPVDKDLIVDWDKQFTELVTESATFTDIDFATTLALEEEIGTWQMT